MGDDSSSSGHCSPRHNTAKPTLCRPIALPICFPFTVDVLATNATMLEDLSWATLPQVRGITSTIRQATVRYVAVCDTLPWHLSTQTTVSEAPLHAIPIFSQELSDISSCVAQHKNSKSKCDGAFSHSDSRTRLALPLKLGRDR